MKRKSELFLEATQKNALRKEAGLPLLDIRQEIEKLKGEDYFKLYADLSQTHAATYARIRADVLAAMRAEKGPTFGLSTGGRWAVDAVAARQFRDFLTGLGYPPPTTGVTAYGR